MPAPSIPEAAPQFRGEKGKDDLHDWVSQSKLWFARTALLNQQLADLRLHGMDLSTFAHKFLKVYKASSTSNKKAIAKAMLLLLNCERLKELHSRLLSMCVEQPKITVEQLVDYMHRHQAL
eukprot:1143580-Pelagomonas_calceolata.AAC.1